MIHLQCSETQHGTRRELRESFRCRVANCWINSRRENDRGKGFIGIHMRCCPAQVMRHEANMNVSWESFATASSASVSAPIIYPNCAEDHVLFHWPMRGIHGHDCAAVALTQIPAYSTQKKSSWTQNYGSDAYAKKRDSVSTLTSQTKHDANDHGTYASMWKESEHRLRRTFYFAESERCCWNGAFVSLFLFVGTHFRIFVRKFLIHLRTIYTHLLKS